MTGISRKIFIIILVVIISYAIFLQIRSHFMTKIDSDTWRPPSSKQNLKKLLEIINIRPGMVILNIGTGWGLTAYKFAEELKGTGKVFATDIKADRIEYVAQEARRRGLNNLYPVLVNKNGVDPFYSKHQYDLIIMFHLYYQLKNRLDYLKKIRRQLKKEGRLFLGLNKSFPLFSMDDFTDFKGLVKELATESPDSPFIKYLRKSTQRLLKTSSDEPNDLLKNDLLTYFNEILLNPDFIYNFLHHGIKGFSFKEPVSFSAEENFYIEWLLKKLREGIVDNADFFLYRYFPFLQKRLKIKSIGKTGSSEKEWMQYRIKALNKLIIIQRFRRYLYDGEKSLDSRAYTSMKNKRYSLIKKTLISAGFKFENEYDFIPFVGLLAFIK